MYAKIFSAIFDSSIAENYQYRHVFEDLLKLADPDGVVDMTHEAIARRTNTPVKLVREAIAALEQPDPRSRNPAEEGRRIKRLDAHRDWGWLIVNHGLWRGIKDEAGRREKTRERVRRFREKQKSVNSEVTPACNASSVTKALPGVTSVSVSVGTEGEKGEGQKGGRQPPTKEEFKAFCEMQAIPLNHATACYAYWSARDWLDKHGRVMNWKWVVSTWEINERERAQLRRRVI